MRSDKAKKGIERAPHRSLFKAMGYTDEELARPLIGIVNSKNEIIPGHIHLDSIVNAVKAGVRMAGGTPMEFPAIGVCDGCLLYTSDAADDLLCVDLGGRRHIKKKKQTHIRP